MMAHSAVRIEYLSSCDHRWDDYVYRHPEAKCYHLLAWFRSIQMAYGHKTYCLAAIGSGDQTKPSSHNPMDRGQESAVSAGVATESIKGILPLVHLKGFLFTNSLISVPFLDYGGILAEDRETERALLQESIELGRRLGVNNIELRQTEPVSCFSKGDTIAGQGSENRPSSPSPGSLVFATRAHKVSMLLELPETSEALMKSLRSKVRNQIIKPSKEGLTAHMGGLELLEDFYTVFAINMRHLGSPVHSKRLMRNIMVELPGQSQIVVVYNNAQPLAASIVVGFRDTVFNPWASSLREYSRLSPNMLLYWTMLKFACDKGFRFFDFGRCSPEEGTYKFKKQWGSKPVALNWHYILFNGRALDSELVDKGRYRALIRVWEKLPLPLTKLIGPSLRKRIGL